MVAASTAAEVGHGDFGHRRAWPGLEATYEAVRAGKRVGLANKEVLVSGGKLVMDAVRRAALS